MKSLLKCSLGLIVSFLLTSCSGEIESISSKLENAGGNLTPCEIDQERDFEWSAPARAYLNESITFTTNIENTSWKLRHVDSGEEFLHIGMLWQTSFTKIGVYQGELTAITACEKIETANFQFTIESIPNVSLIIDNGNIYTNIATVSLSLNSSNASEMLISTGSTCNNGVWESYKTTATRNITTANSNNTFSVKFKLQNGVETSCVSDSIIHDNLPPAVSFTLAPSDSSSTSANFRFTGTDNLSGVQSYHCQLNSSTVTTCSSPKAYTVPVGQNQFRVYAIDKAGNTSQTIVHTWIVSHTPPPATPTPTPVPPQPPTVGNDYSCDGITKPAGAFDTKYTAMGDMLRVNPPSYFPYLRDTTWSMAPLKSTYNHKNKLTSIPFIIPTSDTSRYFRLDIIQLQPINNNLLGSVSSTKKGIMKITPCQNDYRKAYAHHNPQMPISERDPYLMSGCYSAAFNGRITTEIVDNIEAHIASGKTSCPIVRGKKYYINFIVGDEGSVPGSNPTQSFDCTISAGPRAGQIGDYCAVNLSIDLI